MVGEWQGHRVAACVCAGGLGAGLAVLEKQVSGKKRLLEPRAAL